MGQRPGPGLNPPKQGDVIPNLPALVGTLPFRTGRRSGLRDLLVKVGSWFLNISDSSWRKSHIVFLVIDSTISLITLAGSCAFMTADATKTP